MNYPDFSEPPYFEMPRDPEGTNLAHMIWGGLGNVGREVFGGKQYFFRASKG
jgi:hypothetical protein